MTDFAKFVANVVQTPAAPRTGGVNFDAPHPTHDLHRLPQTDSLLFGGAKRLSCSTRRWNDGKTSIVAFTAGGGVGKSTLARVWTEMLAEDGWRGRGPRLRVVVLQPRHWPDDGLRDLPQRSVEVVRGERLGRQVDLGSRGDPCREDPPTPHAVDLDGVEPLQSGEDGVDRGSIRDPGLRTLLEELAKGHPGLCVVTTRERLVDSQMPPSRRCSIRISIESLRSQAERCSASTGWRGDDKELEAAVENVGGHALAVSLLGNLLKDGNKSPHISGVNKLPALAHPEREGVHPRRVLDAWAQRFGDGAELELLHIVGLFDRPAERKAIQAAIDGDRGRTNSHLRKAELDAVLKRLRGARLLAKASNHDDTSTPTPSSREHFGARLKALHPKSWQEGHRRLYQHFKDTAEYQPSDLPGMQPLFAAVLHGCAAGLYQEACEEVYRDRIVRREDCYLTKKLGGFAADLSCLSCFIARRWQHPHSELDSPFQKWVVGQADSSCAGSVACEKRSARWRKDPTRCRGQRLEECRGTIRKSQ